MGKKASSICNGFNGRNNRGQFVKGYRGGPGNPDIVKKAKFRRAFEEAITKKDLADIAKKAVELAKDGDVAAMHFIFDRLLGKPKQDVEITGQLGIADAWSDEELIERAKRHLLNQKGDNAEDN